jgi:hypothetical protein
MALGALVMGVVLEACSTGMVATAKPEAPTVQAKAAHILDEVSQLRPGVVSATCTGSKCTGSGSSSAPLVAGLDRAATQLQRLHVPADERGQVLDVIAQLRLMAGVLQQESSISSSDAVDSSQADLAIGEAASLNAALSKLRTDLHLHQQPGGSFL